MAYRSRRKPTIDFNRLIAAGSIPGASHVNKFGRNENLTANTDAVIASGGRTTPVWPTTASVLTFVSTSASDSASGAGAQTVTVYGLDANGFVQTETASLNGVSTTQSSASFLRVYRMVVPAAGSLLKNQGAISACVGGSSIATIAASKNQTLMAVYTVPACTVGLINNFYASVNKSTSVAAGNAQADVEGWYRLNGEDTFRIGFHVGLISSGTSSWSHQFVPPYSLPALTDLYVSACADDTGTDVSAGFDITLLEK